ncbi:hypothetical protein [Wenjunlia tyrosinilytica]|uniref:Integral membrane protein n=1 Tax=Wenjunlia tyrosinilytica TaxID=1544741 RepID=A0A917ZIX7_9ACTN|nr:hypothetical protein [Wenjunlia tyrosinilytica]GGO83826.1 hypothetical protein GCM10012280_13850 [Wenjunlia tyrosinilytica]
MQAERLAKRSKEQLPRITRSSRATAGPMVWPAAVAAVFTLAQILLVGRGTAFSWDETVYLSQTSPDVPAAFFSAPRARGVPVLVAPILAVTSSPTAIRVCLAVMSGAALLLAMRVWRSLLPTAVLTLAGALFASLWTSLYYGPAAMPNLWVALACLAAVGWFLRAARDRRDTPALIGLAAAVAFAALMRPLDAFWLALPLGVPAVAHRRWRHPVILVALVCGLAAGWADWVIEAYAHYGGLSARVHRASEIQGRMTWHLALDDQARALAGKTLCRPCDGPWQHRYTAAWWFALPPLVVGGLWATARSRARAATWLPTPVAASLALPYLFLIDYAAPRFLLPAHALLAIPVATCLVWLVTGLPARLRPAAAVLVALGLCLHVAIQFQTLVHVTARSRALRADTERVAAELRRQGVRPPCVVSGAQAIPIGFSTGCASRQTYGHDASITPAGLEATAGGEPVAVLVSKGDRPPVFARHWRTVPLPDLGRVHDYRAYLAPSVRPVNGPCKGTGSRCPRGPSDEPSDRPCGRTLSLTEPSPTPDRRRCSAIA